jgi:hypothetical protein
VRAGAPGSGDHAVRARVSRRLAVLAIAAVLVAGCSVPESRVESQEDLLLASGFRVRTAQDAKGQSALRALPPNKVVPVTGGGRTVYVYADPTRCKCIYRGNAEAYRKYRILASERDLTSADSSKEAAAPDDWGLVEPEGAW